MNGNQIRKATKAQINASTKARQSPPEPINPERPIGVGQATWAIGGLTNPKLIAKYATDIEAIGAKKKGIAVYGL